MITRERSDLTDLANQALSNLEGLALLEAEHDGMRHNAPRAMGDVRQLRAIALRLEHQVYAVQQLAREWTTIANNGYWYDGSELTSDQANMIWACSKAIDYALERGPWLAAYWGDDEV